MLLMLMLSDCPVQECTFQHGDRKPVRGLKSTLLYDMFPDREVVAGRTLNYTCGKDDQPTAPAAVCTDDVQQLICMHGPCACTQVC